jgi:hypothetical protein
VKVDTELAEVLLNVLKKEEKGIGWSVWQKRVIRAFPRECASAARFNHCLKILLELGWVVKVGRGRYQVAEAGLKFLECKALSKSSTSS